MKQGMEGVPADAARADGWTPLRMFEDFALGCCGHPHLNLVSDPESFSLTQRVRRTGPAHLSDIVVGSDVSMYCGEGCNSYRVLVLLSGRTSGVNRGVSICADPGTAVVYTPEGDGVARWSEGARLTCFKIDSYAIDQALRDALHQEVTPQIQFSPVMPNRGGLYRSWIEMLTLFKEQLLRPESLLTQPLVGLPFVDSLVRGFLLVSDHPYREALLRDEGKFAPRAIRAAIELIEEEAHLPLTVSEIASRTHLSPRTLHDGFRRYLNTSPMAYVREVRLRRVRQTLLGSDPSIVTVASVAHRWGFVNLGRFAATYAARFGEAPRETLRRI